MIGTFALVTLQSFVNRIVSKIKRLRNPRYLVGAIAGIIYFYFVVFRRVGRNANATQALSRLGFSDLRVDLVAIVVLGIALLAWALPGDEGGIEFTEAEIAFLFPAPLRRRDILLYKVIRSQPQIFVTSIIGTLFGARGGWFVGLWAAFTVAQLYSMMTALARARLRLAGINFLARIAAVVGVAALLGWYGWTHIGPVLKTIDSNHTVSWDLVHQALNRGLPGAVLFLPRLFAAAIFPKSVAGLAISVGALAGLGAVFLMIGARLNVSFEEASIAVSQKRLARTERMQGRRGGQSVMFRRMPAPGLRATGLAETAIVWKNVVALLRVSSGWVVVFLAVYLFVVGEAVFAGGAGVVSSMGIALGVLAGIFVFIGPGIFANDLRLDFSRLEVLKSYPISGERLIAAEIAAPLAVVAFFELLFLTTSATLIDLGGIHNPRVTVLASAQYVTVALLVAIPVCALQLVLRNAVPVLFPGWAGRSKEDPRGIAFTGQRLVMLIGNLLVLSLALLPAVIVLVPSLWVASKFFAGHTASIAVATMPAVCILAAEVWLAVKALGAQFERLDVSNEIDIVEFA